MGAGITKKQERDKKRNWLIRIARDLRKAGVTATYVNMQVLGPGFEVSCGRTVRASNGEAWGNLQVVVGLPGRSKRDWEYEVACGDTELGYKEWEAHVIESHADQIERYSFLEATDYGLERIKALYGDAWHQAKLAETELAWLITKIERKAKQDGPVFLLTPEGKLFDSGEPRNKYEKDERGRYPGAMYEGQLYWYNEMQNGKPMLRVRQGGGPENYMEFLPGWCVVDKDGKTVAERKL